MAVNPDFRDLFSAFNAAGVRYLVIGRTELIANKRACGRPQDLLDVDQLLRHS
jgi:hypothetical protein